MRHPIGKPNGAPGPWFLIARGGAFASAPAALSLNLPLRVAHDSILTVNHPCKKSVPSVNYKSETMLRVNTIKPSTRLNGLAPEYTSNAAHTLMAIFPMTWVSVSRFPEDMMWLSTVATNQISKGTFGLCQIVNLPFLSLKNLRIKFWCVVIVQQCTIFASDRQ